MLKRTQQEEEKETFDTVRRCPKHTIELLHDVGSNHVCFTFLYVNIRIIASGFAFAELSTRTDAQKRRCRNRRYRRKKPAFSYTLRKLYLMARELEGPGEYSEVRWARPMLQRHSVLLQA